MKRTLLLTFALLASYAAIAQSSFKLLDFHGNDITSGTIQVWGDTGTTIEAKIKAINLNSSALNVKTKRIENNVINGTVNYFCWTICYAPMTNESPSGLTINPGDTNTAFYADYVPYSNIGTTTITYVFFDANNRSDSAFVVVNYNATPVGIPTIDVAKNFMGLMAPNPVNTIATVGYKIEVAHLPASLVVFDNAGKKVQEMIIKNVSGTAELNCADLTPGQYYISLRSSNRTVATRPFIVVH